MRLVRYSGFPRHYGCAPIYTLIRAWIRLHDNEDSDGFLELDALLREWTCYSEEVNYARRGQALGRGVGCSSLFYVGGVRDDPERIVSFKVRNSIL